MPPPGGDAACDRPAVELHEPAGDRQPEPGARRVRSAGEPLEDVGQELGIDPGTGVADDELDPPLAGEPPPGTSRRRAGRS